MQKFALLLSLLLVSLNAAAGQMYRWVDAQGKVHYTDEPPPASAKQVQQKNLGAAGAGSAGTELPYALQIAARKYPVTLYVTDCGEACDKARSHLSQRGIPYAAKNPGKSPADHEALQQLTGKLEVPALVVGGNVTIRYQPAAWDSLLDAAGYPKTNLLPKKPATANAEKGDRKGTE